MNAGHWDVLAVNGSSNSGIIVGCDDPFIFVGSTHE